MENYNNGKLKIVIKDVIMENPTPEEDRIIKD